MNTWGSVQILGGAGPPTPSGCDHVQQNRYQQAARAYVMYTRTSTCTSEVEVIFSVFLRK